MDRVNGVTGFWENIVWLLGNDIIVVMFMGIVLIDNSYNLYKTSIVLYIYINTDYNNI